MPPVDSACARAGRELGSTADADIADTAVQVVGYNTAVVAPATAIQGSTRKGYINFLHYTAAPVAGMVLAVVHIVG